MSDFGWIGPYELLGELGRGAMARVWRAWDPSAQRQVAIKEPLFDGGLTGTSQSELGRRFASEARVASQLSHPGIVRVYDADVWDGRPAIVMELVEGKTLAQVLELGRLMPGEALAVLDQLLDAVGYAHGCGVIHRDIKPDNIFVSHDGIVKLADFGIARMEGRFTTVGTMLGTVLGTPGYLSPEQAVGNRVDGRSDLFSVGVVAYEMLTGANPFGVGDATTLLYRIVHEPVPELPAWASEGLDADLRPAIMSALAKDPAQRPQSAGEFKALLHDWPLSQVPVSSPASPQADLLGAVRRDVGTNELYLDHGTIPETVRVDRDRQVTVRDTTVRSQDDHAYGMAGPVAGSVATWDADAVDTHAGTFDWHGEDGGRPGSRGAWLPIALVLGVAAVVLVGVLVSATSGAGGGGGGGGSAATSTSASSITPSASSSQGQSQDTEQDSSATDTEQGEADERVEVVSQTQSQGETLTQTLQDTSQTTESQSQVTTTTATAGEPAFPKVEASSTLAPSGSVSFAAEKAVDGDLSTAWGEGVAGYGTSTVGFGSGESLWLRADTEQEVHGIRIAGGYAVDEGTYRQYGRCRTVYVALSDGTLIEADLADAYRQYQTIDFGGTYKTTFVYVSLGGSVYEGSAYDSTMISEIQVY